MLTVGFHNLNQPLSLNFSGSLVAIGCLASGLYGLFVGHCILYIVVNQ